MKIVLVLTISVAVLAGCGGGGGADSKVTCSDFRYQEDAQSAYNSGASRLDGDNDGRACESLPRRPVVVIPVITNPSVPAVVVAGTPPKPGRYAGVSTGGMQTLEGVVDDTGVIWSKSFTMQADKGLGLLYAAPDYKSTGTFTASVFELDQFGFENRYLSQGTYGNTAFKFALPSEINLVYGDKGPLNFPVGRTPGTVKVEKNNVEGVTIDYNPNISSFNGTTSTGCTFSGQMNSPPNSWKKLSMTFDTFGQCQYSGRRFEGVAFESTQPYLRAAGHAVRPTFTVMARAAITPTVSIEMTFSP